MNIQFCENMNNELLSCNFIIPVGQDSVISGYSGFAHIIEHLLFHGHSDLTQYELLNRIECMGALINGVTYDTHTIIFARVESNALVELVELIVNAITSFDISKLNFETEKAIVKNEENFHGYGGDYFIRKKLKSIANIKVKEAHSLRKIKEIYQKAYVLDNWTLLIVGKIANSMKSVILEKFKGLSFGEVTTNLQYDRVIHWAHNILVPYCWGMRRNHSNWFCYLRPCKQMPKYYCKLLKYIFTSGLSSYFYDIIVAQNGYAYSLDFLDDQIDGEYFAIIFEYTGVSFSKLQKLFEEVFENDRFIYELNEDTIIRAVNMTCTEYELKGESFSSIVNDLITSMLSKMEIESYSQIIHKLKNLSIKEIKKEISDLIY